jgi:hypothetical protein
LLLMFRALVALIVVVSRVSYLLLRCAPPYEFFSACPCASYQFAVSTPFAVHPSVHPRSWPRKVTAESRTLGNACAKCENRVVRRAANSQRCRTNRQKREERTSALVPDDGQNGSYEAEGVQTG